MKIIALLCLIVGVFCFAAKDALDVRTTQLQTQQNSQITLNNLAHQNTNNTQDYHTS